MSVKSQKMLRIGQSATKPSGTFTIYRLANTVNGKAYVGITGRQFPLRLDEHFSRARCGNRKSRIYDAIRKYGEDSFRHDVLDTANSEEEARELERHYIKVLNTHEHGYNSNLGGFGFLTFPAHIRAKISAAQKGKIISEECRAKMSAAKLGDNRCAEHLGEHTQKGSSNPRSAAYRIRLPDGTELKIRGMRKFCRENDLSSGHLFARGKTKGFVLLGRLND